MIPRECKRLAEVDFPIAEISKHAARETSIRHGHPSTLHLWWARRPLASSRAVLLALLLPDPCDAHCRRTLSSKRGRFEPTRRTPVIRLAISVEGRAEEEFVKQTENTAELRQVLDDLELKDQVQVERSTLPPAPPSP